MQTKTSAKWLRCDVTSDEKHNPQVEVLTLQGAWLKEHKLPVANSLDEIYQSGAKTICFKPCDDFQWDTRFMTFLLQCYRRSAANDIQLDVSLLPDECQQLFKLATAVAPQQTSSRPASLFFSFKKVKLAAEDQLHFVGEVTLAFFSLLTGRARTRVSDCFFFFQQTGPNAVPIITLISILVGMILAYLGLIQLRQFGAQVYIADLVAIGMAREMGALMTAIILAGRTGASYAAQLGTMQVNEEIDALVTLGMRPVEYLVLPRIFALVVAMPLLTIYSNVLGIIGGALVATGMDLTFTQYFHHVSQALSIHSILTGCFKSMVFGLLIAMAGCQAGMRCGRSSAAVGEATTKAVVSAIIYLVVADAAINIIYYKLGI